MRFASALAVQADPTGRVRSKMSMFSDLCQVGARRMSDHISRLAELGYIQIERKTPQGAFSVTLCFPGNESEHDSAKRFIEVSGAVVGVRTGAGNAALAIYIESPLEMVKLTVDKAGLGSITSALAIS